MALFMPILSMGGMFSLEKLRIREQTVAGLQSLWVGFHTHALSPLQAHRRGKTTESKHMKGPGLSVHRAKWLPRKAAAIFTLKAVWVSWPATPCLAQRALLPRAEVGGGHRASTVRLHCKQGKNTLYIWTSRNRPTFMGALRNLYRHSVPLDWVLSISF